MIQLRDVLKIVDTFNREGVEYKLFGGMAVNLHGYIHNTEDVDFFIDPSATRSYMRTWRFKLSRSTASASGSQRREGCTT